ncbi:hypothetical protein PGTUg99_004091 [Puccinia graminis f. sp. tritici]|uniref:Uncharacterized protein n=1 Tax=Puccinia graminis f. sp. tritici TaxID=56615 RepID=A0A5B0SJZ5_PUCGR|nr:hypothetical protein PGTUg99_004091 [Puccinia graminis f. sp. tritici]
MTGASRRCRKNMFEEIDDFLAVLIGSIAYTIATTRHQPTTQRDLAQPNVRFVELCTHMLSVYIEYPEILEPKISPHAALYPASRASNPIHLRAPAMSITHRKQPNPFKFETTRCIQAVGLAPPLPSSPPRNNAINR